MIRHETDPQAASAGVIEIRERQVRFAENLSEMSILPCDLDGEVLDEHPVIHFPKKVGA